MAIDAILTGLGRLAGALPEARAMIGDVADVSPMGPRIAALGEMVKKAGSKAAKVVDDWGWKGGKPGELTGGEFVKKRYDLHPSEYAADAWEDLGYLSRDDAYDDYFNGLYGNPAREYANAASTDAIDELRDQATEQVSKKLINRLYRNAGIEVSIDDLMSDFYALERSGIPRSYTGKVLAPIYERLARKQNFQGGIDDATAQAVSDLMRPMTNDQREAFLNLLPRWTGTMDQAATAAKKLYKRPS